ncbi:MAG: nitroreductase/quinone reductase family protein [Gammaproteobacteria bacterium]|nr:nitroreductase/quinone reductase family protein [Gammaproteobacteria bacterium]
MRIPDAFFPFINFAMKLLLRSPLHFVVSSHILLITFKGRKSGRTFTTPVRYLREGSTVRLFSSPQANWWKNLRGGADVSVRIRGNELKCRATVLETVDDAKLRIFRAYLARFPGDAVYHGLKPSRRSPHPEDTLRAILHEVAITEVTLP